MPGPNSTTAIRIRPYKPVDAWQLTEIFYNSVHGIDARYYSLQELNAWAPLPVDYLHWRERFDSHTVWVAELDGEPVGFTCMESDGYIDWLYIHSDYQRRGVARSLYNHLETLAREQEIQRLSVHASHVAKPFFEKRGFTTLQRCSVERLGVALHNWRMEKPLL